MGRPAKPPRLKLRDGIWHIHDTANGYRRSTGTADEKLAERLLKEYVMTLAGFVPPEDPKISDLLEAYRLKKLDDYRERAREGAKVLARRQKLSETEVEEEAVAAAEKVKDTGNMEDGIDSLNRHIGSMRILVINSEMARRYRDARRKEGKRNGGKGEVASTTIHRELGHLKAALNWAWREDRNVWFGQERAMPDFEMPMAQSRGRPHWLTHDEVKKLLEACDEPHLRLYILLATQTGARKSAILGLRWADVDFNRRIVDFGLVDHDKRRPIVKMTTILHQALWAAWTLRSQGSEHVIEYHGKRVANIKKAFHNLVVKCGMDPKEITPHVLKHTYISWLCMSGNFRDLNDIADLADTTVQTIRNHYRHLLPDLAAHVEDAVEIEWGPGDLGLPVFTPVKPPKLAAKQAQAAITAPTKKPTRRQLEQSDRLAKNTHIPRTAGAS